MDRTANVVQYLKKDLANVASADTLREATQLLKYFKTEGERLKAWESDLELREKRLKSNQVALLSARKELK